MDDRKNFVDRRSLFVGVSQSFDASTCVIVSVQRIITVKRKKDLAVQKIRSMTHFCILWPLEASYQKNGFFQPPPKKKLYFVYNINF